MTSPPPIGLWFGLLASVYLVAVSTLVWLTDINRKLTTAVVVLSIGFVSIYIGLKWWMCTPTCLGF